MISHLPDSWPIAVGIGMAHQRTGQSRAVLAFCGDGATSTGLWHESLNMAAVFRTPNVFVVENNQYAYSTPVTRQFRVAQISSRAKAYGMPGVTVDGNDVRAVYAAVQEAVARARAGKGPSLIEAVTMRMDGHAVHDSAEYVPPGLLDKWRALDSIQRLTDDLIRDAVDPGAVESMWSEARTEMEEAAEEAERAPLPDRSTLTDGIYATA